MGGRAANLASGACCTHMKASFGALLTSMAILAGCVGPGRLPFESPKVVEYLDGNYRRLASCTHQQLGRQHSQLRMTEIGRASCREIVEVEGVCASFSREAA